jgi:hypothetical protein
MTFASEVIKTRIKEYHEIIESLQPDRVWAPGQIAGSRDTPIWR